MKNKGITLVGLILTIVAISVVAGVSINVATNEKIIDKTRETSKSYKVEAEKEQWQLAIAEAKDFRKGTIDTTKLEKTLPDWIIDGEGENLTATSPTGNEFDIDSNQINILNTKDEEDEEDEEEKGCYYFNSPELNAQVVLLPNYDKKNNIARFYIEIENHWYYNDLNLIKDELSEDSKLLTKEGKNILKEFEAGNEEKYKNYCPFGSMALITDNNEQWWIYVGYLSEMEYKTDFDFTVLEGATKQDSLY